MNSSFSFAYSVVYILSDISIYMMESTLRPLGDHLQCSHCQTALSERIKILVYQWSRIKVHSFQSMLSYSIDSLSDLRLRSNIYMVSSKPLRCKFRVADGVDLSHGAWQMAE